MDQGSKFPQETQPEGSVLSCSPSFHMFHVVTLQNTHSGPMNERHQEPDLDLHDILSLFFSL